MKKLKIIMHVSGKPEDKTEDIIQAWLENSIDGMTHESFSTEDEKLGELDIKITEVEVTDL